jgi:hypothetical protein
MSICEDEFGLERKTTTPISLLFAGCYRIRQEANGLRLILRSHFSYEGYDEVKENGAAEITLRDRYSFTITPQAMRGPPGPSFVGGSGRYLSSSS